MGFTYAIEHMEEDEATPKSIPPWVELEYAHMRALAGPSAHINFTNLSRTSCRSLSRAFSQSTLATAGSRSHLPCASFQTHTDSIMALLKRHEVPLSRVCLLDPKAEQVLSPEDAKEFSWFLFGGILGDDPPRDRTSDLRVLGFPTRQLGPIQMTTDTALGVTKLIVQDKVPLEKIPYVDYPTIGFNTKESVEMPFRYIAQGSEPLLPPGMRELLREDLNKSFDF